MTDKLQIVAASGDDKAVAVAAGPKIRLSRYKPLRLAANGHVQTILGTMVLAGGGLLAASARRVLLHVEGLDYDARLTGFYSPQNRPKGLAILLHGWLGSVSSGYMRATGEHLYQRGYSVFRLNLRDHGGTGSLNSGHFNSALNREVEAAIVQIAELEPESPLYLAGFSIGGSFALRAALKTSLTFEKERLQHVVSVSPPVNPRLTTLLIDATSAYQYYFLRNWRAMLREKCRAFADQYDYDEVRRQRTLVALTDWMLQFETRWNNSDEYFAAFAITPEIAQGCAVPTTLIAADDDPVVPIKDFRVLTDASPLLDVKLQRYGGHLGFVELPRLQSWLPASIGSVFDQAGG